MGAYWLLGTFGPWGGFGHGAVTRFLRFYPVIKNGGEEGGKRNSKGRLALGHSEMQVRKANLCLNRIEPFVYLFVYLV